VNPSSNSPLIPTRSTLSRILYSLPLAKTAFGAIMNPASPPIPLILNLRTCAGSHMFSTTPPFTLNSSWTTHADHQTTHRPGSLNPIRSLGTYTVQVTSQGLSFSFPSIIDKPLAVSPTHTITPSNTSSSQRMQPTVLFPTRNPLYTRSHQPSLLFTHTEEKKLLLLLQHSPSSSSFSSASRVS